MDLFRFMSDKINKWHYVALHLYAAFNIVDYMVNWHCIDLTFTQSTDIWHVDSKIPVICGQFTTGVGPEKIIQNVKQCDN